MQVRYINLGPNPSPGAKLVAFLVVVLVIALIVAIAVLALGIFLIAAPVMLAAGVLYYLYRRFFPVAAPRTRATGEGIIEGEFHVVDPHAPRIPRRDS